ncbi:MAG TPA: molybdopterin dinucleotide binding domain-containing protein, partial [Tepidisphaeraceae bacterium]|nr:molybdopterin dinucleotide binding domain-containing protein [Tepidisphaeraceae bacterium]
VVFMPMHWGDLWSGAASPNEATLDACDPISRQPGLKLCAVNVRTYHAAEPPGPEVKPIVTALPEAVRTPSP